MLMKTKKILSSENIQTKYKHRALTGFLRVRGVYNVKNLQSIIDKCAVDTHVGCLPPELRSLVSKNNIAPVTKLFFEKLDCLVTDKYEEFAHHTERQYFIDDIASLFNTQCILETYEITNDRYLHFHGWGGAVSNVYKLTFPQLNVSYALKVFNTMIHCHGHGAIYEIPTALCAYHCEPKYNNIMYMANLCGQQYMLSKWVEEKTDKTFIKRPQKSFIYKTDKEEIRKENFVHGKRIDFGRTYKTYYGLYDYKTRKLYRIMKNMTEKQIASLAFKMKTSEDKQRYRDAKMIRSRGYIFDNLSHGFER